MIRDSSGMSSFASRSGPRPSYALADGRQPGSDRARQSRAPRQYRRRAVVFLDQLGLIGREVAGVANQQLGGDVELADVVQTRRLPDGLGPRMSEGERRGRREGQGGRAFGVPARARQVLAQGLQQRLATLADHVGEAWARPARARGGLSLG